MIEQLFGSKTRVKLLQLFYSNPNRSFYVREITRKIDEQINSVRRELANLLNVGIIVSENNNNRLYYEVNQDFEHFLPLQQIFGQGTPSGAPEAGKAAAPVVAGAPDQDKVKSLGNIDVIIFTGQFTRDDRSGVDCLFVGDLNKNSVQKFVAELEAQEGHDLRYTHMDAKEFEYRRNIKDRFITTVLESKKQVILDKNNVL